MNRQRGDVVTIILLVLMLAGAATVIVVAWHKFTESYRDEGRGEVRAQWSPIMSECDRRKLAPAACVDVWLAADRDKATAESNFAGCQAAAKEQSDAVAAANAKADAVRKATSQIIVEITTRYAATQNEVSALRQIAATPAANEREACNEANRVLRELATRRVRYFGGSAVPAAGGANSDGTGSGSGAVRIRP